MRVLTWNLMHGRALPPAAKDLFEQFAEALECWRWDIALLQEVPPWWPAALATRLDTEERRVLTSRNALLPLRRAIAIRWPEVIKSNGGGANAILVRNQGIAEHRTLRLRTLPERRWLQAVRLAEPQIWIGNLHLTVHNDAKAREEAALAARTMLSWAAEAPVLLGGDFNVRGLALEGFTHLGGHDVDHLFARGLDAARAAEPLDRGRLSDHAPVLVAARPLGGSS